MPASTAFCTISNEVRPLTASSVSRAGSASRSSSAADHLVDRVVAPDVLGGRDELAVPGEERGRVEATRQIEARLLRSQQVRQPGEHGSRDAALHRKRRHVGLERLDRAPPAQTARRARQHGAPFRQQTLDLARRSARQRHVDDVLPIDARVHRTRAVRVRLRRVQCSIVPRSSDVRIDTLGQQEAGGQLPVRARRAHDDGEAPAVQPDFERLFDGHAVAPRRALLAADAHDAGVPGALEGSSPTPFSHSWPVVPRRRRDDRRRRSSRRRAAPDSTRRPSPRGRGAGWRARRPAATAVVGASASG